MKKLTKFAATIIIAAGCVNAASAQDGVIRARMGVSQNNFTSLFSGGDLKTNYQSLNTGLTYIDQTGWYVDGALKSSMSAKWNSVEVTTANNNLNDGVDNDFKRQDVTLTLGKALAEGWQVFGGYQSTKSTIRLPAAWITYDPNINFNEEFNVSGFFVGLGKTIPMPVGSVNLNAAVGKMKGKLLDSRSVNHDSSGGSGSSIGVSYSYPIEKNIGLSIEYKQQSYKYDFDGNGIALTAGKDKLSMFGANISYQF